MKEQYKGRLNLTDKASEALSYMLTELRKQHPYISMNTSKLCSLVVEEYAKHQFELDKERIAHENANLKRLVSDQLKEAKTDEDVKAILQGTAQKMAAVWGQDQKRQYRKKKAATAVSADAGGNLKSSE